MLLRLGVFFTFLASFSAQGFAGKPLNTHSSRRPIQKISEGFYDCRAEGGAAVERAWDATFLSYWSDGETFRAGAAVLIAWARKSPQSDDLLFLANEHSFAAACLPSGECPRVSLSQGFAIGSDGTLIRSKSERRLMLEKIKKVDSSPALDLALFSAAAPADSGQDFRPFPIPKQCSELHAQMPMLMIGYPGVYLRPSLRLQTAKKRCSKGNFIGMAPTKVGNELLAWSSVDSLYGNSGGLAIAPDGAWVGLMRQSFSQKENNYSYMGGDGTTLAYQSGAVPCSAVLSYLKAAAGSRLPDPGPEF
jgi:hypothetical protein